MLQNLGNQNSNILCIPPTEDEAKTLQKEIDILDTRTINVENSVEDLTLRLDNDENEIYRNKSNINNLYNCLAEISPDLTSLENRVCCNENDIASLKTCPGLNCTGTLVHSDIADFATCAKVCQIINNCNYTTCTGTVVDNDLNPLRTDINNLKQCPGLNCVGDITSEDIADFVNCTCVKDIINSCGYTTCTGTLVPSDLDDYATKTCVDIVKELAECNCAKINNLSSCAGLNCIGTVTSVNNVAPVNGNVTLVIPPDLTDQVTCNTNDINSIKAKIPNAASSTNQLADKDWVNSTIATETATFIGTFDDVSCLPTTGISNNDYAFIVTTNVETGQIEYTRYKYTNATHSWLCEYTINTSGFTADQLAAINSGITDTLVSKITDVYDNTVTICMNGQCKGSFNLNQSVNCTIDLGSGGLSDVCFDVYCGTTCKCQVKNNGKLCLKPNAFNDNATISTTIYPGACCTGTVSSITLNGNDFTVTNGVASLANFKPATAVCADCSNAIRRVACCDNFSHPLLFTNGCTSICNDIPQVTCECCPQITYNPSVGQLNVNCECVRCQTKYSNCFVDGLQIIKCGNSGRPTFITLADVTDWWDYYNTSCSINNRHTFIGTIASRRYGSGYDDGVLSSIIAKVSYRREDADPAATRRSRSLELTYKKTGCGSMTNIPFIVCDETNNKKCLAIRFIGSDSYRTFTGYCCNVTYSQQYCYTSNTALPTGWSIVVDGEELNETKANCACLVYRQNTTNNDNLPLLLSGASSTNYGPVCASSNVTFNPATCNLTTCVINNCKTFDILNGNTAARMNKYYLIYCNTIAQTSRSYPISLKGTIGQYNNSVNKAKFDITVDFRSTPTLKGIVCGDVSSCYNIIPTYDASTSTARIYFYSGNCNYTGLICTTTSDASSLPVSCTAAYDSMEGTAYACCFWDLKRNETVANATCFNGCTYACAKAEIQDGMVTVVDKSDNNNYPVALMTGTSNVGCSSMTYNPSTDTYSFINSCHNIIFGDTFCTCNYDGDFNSCVISNGSQAQLVAGNYDAYIDVEQEESCAFIYADGIVTLTGNNGIYLCSNTNLDGDLNVTGVICASCIIGPVSYNGCLIAPTVCEACFSGIRIDRPYCYNDQGQTIICDDGTVGNMSIAIGHSAKSYGCFQTVIGGNTVANDGGTVIVGWGSIAEDAGVVVGANSCTSCCGVAIGYNANSKGGGVAIGHNAQTGIVLGAVSISSSCHYDSVCRDLFQIICESRYLDSDGAPHGEIKLRYLYENNCCFIPVKEYFTFNFSLLEYINKDRYLCSINNTNCPLTLFYKMESYGNKCYSVPNACMPRPYPVGICTVCSIQPGGIGFLVCSVCPQYGDVKCFASYTLSELKYQMFMSDTTPNHCGCGLTLNGKQAFSFWAKCYDCDVCDWSDFCNIVCTGPWGLLKVTF